MTVSGHLDDGYGLSGSIPSTAKPCGMMLDTWVIIKQTYSISLSKSAEF